MNPLKTPSRLIDTTIYSINYKYFEKYYAGSVRYLTQPDAGGKIATPIKTAAGYIDLVIKLPSKPPALLYGIENPAQYFSNALSGWDYQPYDLIFIVGMGLGYLPIEAVKRNKNRARIVIIEPYPAFFDLAMRLLDLKPILENDRVSLILGGDLQARSIVAQLQDYIPIGRNKLIVHPNYPQLIGDSIIRLQTELSAHIQATRDIWSTTKKHGRLMFTNAISNLPSLFAGTAFKALRNRFTSFSAFCVAAGPSLDDAIVDLKRVGNHALVIACDSAVHALVNAGIQPHIVVTTDVFEYNWAKLKAYVDPLENTILIYSIESNPNCVKWYLGLKRTAVTAYNKLILGFLNERLELECQLPTMASVGQMALLTAVALGANPINLVGMDLAYAMGKSHSFDSVFYHSVEKSKLVVIDATNGLQVSTAPQFVTEKLIVDNIIAQSNARFAQTSIQGARIKGAQVKTITEVVDACNLKKQTINTLLSELKWSSIASERKAVKILVEIHEELTVAHQICHQMIAKMKEDGEQDNHLYLLAMIKKQLDFFKCQHPRVEAIIKEVMLASIQELKKKLEIVAAASPPGESVDTDHGVEILNDEITIYIDGLDFVLRELQCAIDYFNGISRNSDDSGSLGIDHQKQLERASFYATHGELWQANREYQIWFKNHPSDINAHTALGDIFLEKDMIQTALDTIQKAIHVHGPAVELLSFLDRVEQRIDLIFIDMKDSWKRGDMPRTRKLLLDYLRLRPSDLQAHELKAVIGELDRTMRPQPNLTPTASEKKAEVKKRLDMAAKKIAEMDFEVAIGILEGIAVSDPQYTAIVRETIGDTRAMQKDWISARWNYQQALATHPDAERLKEKIAQLGQSRSMSE